MKNSLYALYFLILLSPLLSYSQNPGVIPDNLDPDAGAVADLEEPEVTIPPIGDTPAERDLLKLANISALVEPRLSDAEWNEIIGTFNEEYSIAQGDNLWDISARLFASGFYWPKVWAINQIEITNPHWIEPGQVLQFTSSADVPPQITLEDGEGAEDGSQYEQEQTGGEGSIALPDSGQGSSDSFQKVRRSYPDIDAPSRSAQWRDYYPPHSEIFTDAPATEDVPAIDLSFDIGSLTQIEQSFRERSYMSGRMLDTVGTIEASSSPNDMLRPDDKIFVRLKKPYAKGTVLTVVQKEERYESDFSDRRGFVYQVIGDVEVEDTVEGFYQANILATRDVVKREYDLVPKMPVRPQPTEVPADRRVEAVLLRSVDKLRGNLGFGDFGFIDRGKFDGVMRGNVFQYYITKIIDDKIKITFTESTLMAELKVVRVEDRFSTVFVSYARDFIPVGSILITKGFAEFISPDEAPPPPDQPLVGVQGDFKTDTPDVEPDPLDEDLPELDDEELRDLEELSTEAGFPQGEAAAEEELEALETLDELDNFEPGEDSEGLEELETLEAEIGSADGSGEELAPEEVNDLDDLDSTFEAKSESSESTDPLEGLEGVEQTSQEAPEAKLNEPGELSELENELEDLEELESLDALEQPSDPGSELGMESAGAQSKAASEGEDFGGDVDPFDAAPDESLDDVLEDVDI